MKIIDNPIDKYGNPIPKEKQCCRWCNKSIKRLTEQVPIDQPTNHIVVSKDRNIKAYDEWGDLIRDQKPMFKRVWDGQTYNTLRYGNFCMVKCAVEFANRVVREVDKKQGKVFL